jgi:hypothetical protein
MSARKKKAVSFNPADLGAITKANPYLQRLIEDSDLRDNVRTAIDSTRSAYTRLSNGKAPARALLEDKKLQKDLRNAIEAAREATDALTDAPKRRRRKGGMGLGRLMMLAILGGVAAMVASEKLRSKALDMVFGSEEEFQYTPPPATPTSTEPSTPVSAA